VPTQSAESTYSTKVARSADPTDDNRNIALGVPPLRKRSGNSASLSAPDGAGLPEESGAPTAGRDIFKAACARCHGEQAEGRVGPVLVGQGRLVTAKPMKTVGSFWSYATSVSDYINRAMPFDKPGSLKPAEVYALTAYLLNLNKIIGGNQVMDVKSLPKVKMPNRDRFARDPRPDVGSKAKGKR
jgi:cytochrome c